MGAQRFMGFYPGPHHGSGDKSRCRAFKETDEPENTKPKKKPRKLAATRILPCFVRCYGQEGEGNNNRKRKKNRLECVGDHLHRGKNGV